MNPGPQGDPGEGLSDNAKALLLSLLAGTAPNKAAALAALRAEWGLADPDADTTPGGRRRGRIGGVSMALGSVAISGGMSK